MRSNSLKTLSFIAIILSAGSAYASSSKVNKAKVEDNKVKALYGAITALGVGDCGMGSCFADLNSLSCQWSKGAGSDPATCTAVDKGGQSQNFSGSKAKALVAATLAYGNVETICDSGKCGFTKELSVRCRTGIELSDFYECSVAPMGASQEEPAKLKEVAGFRIEQIASGSIYDKLGLKNGDILLEFNGKPATTGEVLENFASSLKSSETLDLTIKRSGEIRKMKYALN